MSDMNKKEDIRMRKVLIFQGGWDGHEPKAVSARFARLLEDKGYQAEVYDTQDCLKEAERLLEYDLIIPCWTMGEIPNEYVENISRAVAKGTGLAGCHGGMCDAFRLNTGRTGIHGQYLCGFQSDHRWLGGFPGLQRALLSSCRSCH